MNAHDLDYIFRGQETSSEWLMWRRHRSRGELYEAGQARPVAGHARPDGPADAGFDGRDARLRDRAPHRTGKWEQGAAQPGNDLCLANPATAARMDLRVVGNFRE